MAEVIRRGLMKREDLRNPTKLIKLGAKLSASHPPPRVSVEEFSGGKGAMEKPRQRNTPISLPLFY